MVVKMMDGGDAGAVEAVVERAQLVNKQAAQIQGSTQSFAAAGGKGFHIEPEAAATLVNACNQSILELTDLQSQMRAIRQALQSGTTPGARVVAPSSRTSRSTARTPCPRSRT